MLRFNKVFPSGVSAFMTDKRINFALPKKGNPLTPHQRGFLNRTLGRTCGVANVRQVHGCRVILGRPAYLKRKIISRADAVVTDVPRLAIAVRTADCLPVFIYDPEHRAVGIVHAGWKGTKQKIAVNAVRMMRRKFGSRPAKLKVVFGPSIRKCCYQVGREFKRRFPKETVKTADGLFLDLPGVNRHQLVSSGVQPRNIHEDKSCTFCSKKYFSFRRQGKKAGRMISVMMLNK